MRYIRRQRHRYSCAAVALANAVKRFGVNISYKEMLSIWGGPETFKGDGVEYQDFVAMAEGLGLKVRVFLNPPFEATMAAAAHPDYAAVLLYHYGVKGVEPFGGHFAHIPPSGCIQTGRKKITASIWEETGVAWDCRPVLILLSDKDVL